MTALATQYRAALDEWKSTGSADAADRLSEIENEVCAHLDLPLDETEQGLTPRAQSIIDAWLAKEATIVRAKVHRSGIDALAALIEQNDPQASLPMVDEDLPEFGMVTADQYKALVALLNNLRSPFVEVVR